MWKPYFGLKLECEMQYLINTATLKKAAQPVSTQRDQGHPETKFKRREPS
jgi:hypothetical protein